MFAREAEEQSKWNEGFKAGVKEVLHELQNAIDDSDLEGPTRKWVEELSIKTSSKYI
jgi:hypothetical protein